MLEYFAVNILCEMTSLAGLVFEQLVTSSEYSNPKLSDYHVENLRQPPHVRSIHSC